MSKPTTCAFCLTEWTINQPREWHEHVAICINSLLANTTLNPVLFWAGKMDHPFLKVLSKWIPDIRPGGMLFEELVNSLPQDRKGQAPEVARSVLMKLEAAWLIEEPLFIVSDIDTLWLRDPPPFTFEGAIAVGPGFYPDNYAYFNAGIIWFNRDRWLLHRESLITAISRDLPNQPQFTEQTALNRTVRDWSKIPPNWETRAWWPVPTDTPAVCHFHGPKLYQIRELSVRVPPEPHSATVKLFVEHREAVMHWLKVAEGYRNHPYPIFDEVRPHCRNRLHRPD
jgi:hypothetical protein